MAQQAGQAAPAWKANQQQQRRKGYAQGQNVGGSKILLSELPIDVSAEEVHALFTKTVGEVHETFIVYNSQGNSKGMAVVRFAREGDAYLARNKYNGKIIDGRKPIKIEIIKDEDQPTATPAPAAKAAPPSLLERLGGFKGANGQVAVAPMQTRRQAAAAAAKAAPVIHVVPAAQPRQPGKAVKLRQKKGPKRVKKTAVRLTAEQLDADIEAYKTKSEDAPMN